MICLKKIKIITIFLLGALCGSAQVLRQFNGVVNIDQLSIEVIIPGVETRANMTFTDPAGKFSGLDTQVGDHIIDAAGNGFEVTIISYADGGNLKLTVKSLDGVDLAPKIGVLYRPTSKGINLLGLSDDPTLVGTVVNSALLQIAYHLLPVVRYYQQLLLPSELMLYTMEVFISIPVPVG